MPLVPLHSLSLGASAFRGLNEPPALPIPAPNKSTLCSSGVGILLTLTVTLGGRRGGDTFIFPLPPELPPPLAQSPSAHGAGPAPPGAPGPGPAVAMAYLGPLPHAGQGLAPRP